MRTVLVFFCLLTTPIWAQETPGPDTGNAVIANGSLLHSLLAAPVTGHPYSAVQVHNTQRTLTDGTKISHQGHHFVARDASGRVHVEMRMGRGENGQPDPAIVFVLDPVAHTLTTWVSAPDSPRQASVYRLPASPESPQTGAPQDSSPSASTRPQPIITVEGLGTETLQGVPVSVQRITTILPIGRSGNDAPIAKTDEKWLSADMQLVLKEQWNDPRTGERTVELTHLSLAEPDPALFQPPSGYSVKNALDSLKELEKKLGDAQQ